MEKASLDSLPVSQENTRSTEQFDLWLKRALDIGVSGLSLIVLLPFLPFIALLIKLDSDGPIFYRRRVLGMSKSEFDAFKFRTMRVDGDAVLSSMPDLVEQLNRDGKLQEDPRVTRIGYWLRRFSIDELPQLGNVLRGEMSMVGPRMISPPELVRFGSYAEELLSVRPGITGLWQVSGRADLAYEDRVLLNLQYIRTRNIWFDIKILLLTLPAVFLGKGAY
jgi:lipopolysaccharide/colanic/teichoic acid biosynthesis glycosyltransferase